MAVSKLIVIFAIEMVTVYTPHITLRIRYIVRHIFNNILGTDIVLMDDPDQYAESSGMCINYSEKNLQKGLWICPHPLLSEYGCSAHVLEMGQWYGWPCFFLQTQGDIPFDLFSASFFLLSRYEEYGSPHSDSLGRFPVEQSLAYKEGFLDLPVVDRWARQLMNILSDKDFRPDSALRTFRFISTFDIDHPFCYRNKGFLKNLAGGTADLIKGNFSLVRERLLTQLHLQPDPYMDILDKIDKLHQQHDKEYFLFIHTGGYGKYDRRTIYPQRLYYRYLRSLYNVRFGLHPSYKASFNPGLIRKEKEKLEKILECDISRNRQHFLRMQLPDTLQELYKLGFTEDFTLAYASRPGFRAGTAIPFLFYDLQNEEQTNLLLRPTILMDATFISYLHMQPDEAFEKIRLLADECALSGGDFTMLWHNSVLAGPEQNPWYKVFVDSFLYGISLEKELSLTKN